jgi:hypothetical protein
LATYGNLKSHLSVPGDFNRWKTTFLLVLGGHDKFEVLHGSEIDYFSEDEKEIVNVKPSVILFV